MKPFAHLCFAALTLATASAQAEVPVYRDQQLDLPSAVVLTDSGAAYYGDVRFSANPDGSFKLVEAKRRNLAQVDTATVAVDQTFVPAQAVVSAAGIQSIACVGLEEPAVVRDGDTFYVALAETPIDPLALCMPFVAVTEFDVDVPLDLSGLQAGTYAVVVNGVETSFTLTRDNDVGGTQHPLVGVDEITVVSEATVPAKVEVTVDGYKSVPCVDLEPLRMSRSGNTFYVVITETVLGPAESCIAMIDPFSLSFELDTFGLNAGTYTLNVNGTETEFDLLVP